MVNTKIRLIIFFNSQRWRSSKSQQKQDLELTVAQTMHSILLNSDCKLKKVGKTTRPYRYDLNQIPYNYTVEVANRFNGLDLIDRVPDKLWTKVCVIVQEAVIETIPKKKKCRKAKWLSEEGLQIAEKTMEVKGKGEKTYPLECRVLKDTKERKESLPQ